MGGDVPHKPGRFRHRYPGDRYKTTPTILRNPTGRVSHTLPQTRMQPVIQGLNEAWVLGCGAYEVERRHDQALHGPRKLPDMADGSISPTIFRTTAGSWIRALEIFRRENPDMAYILMAQCDDAGHCIGSACDPSEFIDAVPPYEPPTGCEKKPEYQLVSTRNKLIFKEAALNVVRDVDVQFGRLIDGLEKQGVLGRSRVLW